MSGEVQSKDDGADKSGTYLAKPPGECCLEGTIHQGEPRGSFTTIADVETYIAAPKDGNGNGHIILYFSDIWGFYINNFLLMDAFADAGYTVLGLDFFQGVRSPSCSSHRRSRSLIYCRIPSGSIGKAKTTSPTRTSISMHGRRSIRRLPRWLRQPGAKR
jgi:dienelactone hydrolase